MSSAAKGAQRCGSVMTKLARLRFRCARVSASGQRRGKRREENGIPGDIIAWAPSDSRWPHLLIEVGGSGKRIAVTFAELLEHPLPAGHAAIVATCVGKRWRWYIDPDSRFGSLIEALEALAS